MNNARNTDNTESIVDLMKNIEKNEIVLPEFQRDFVWEISKTYDLFDSLVRNIFIGALIYGKPSSEITTRELDNRPRKTKNRKREKLKIHSYTKEEIDTKIKSSNFRLLLDGQQRVTSIYRALNGTDAVWFIAKKPEELQKKCEELQKKCKDCPLEELLHEFEGTESQERLSIKISDVYTIMNGSYREVRVKEDFFDKLAFITASSVSKNNEDDFDKFLCIIGKIQDLFKSEKLLSYYLLDTSDEKFALFFERSNSRAVNLNFIDILAAKLYSGFNLRDKVDLFQYENPEISLNKEIIVRAISYIASGSRNVEKAYILSKLTHKDFAEHWGKLCELYKKCISFLEKNHFIISQSWMPYENMLIPLMLFLKKIGGDFSQATQKQIEFIRSWYWAAVFSQRYAGSTNDTIVQDTRILETIAETKKIHDKNYLTRLFKIQIESYDELYSYSKSTSAIYSGVLNLVNYHAKGLPDWNNSGTLHPSQKLEEHHIFPKEYLKSKHPKSPDVSEYIDSVVNRVIVPKITNIKIGSKSPLEYLEEMKKANPKLDETTLQRHLIDDSLLDDRDYMGFLSIRAKAIFRLIQEHIIDKKDSIMADFYDEGINDSTP